jgi:hypothetical protein
MTRPVRLLLALLALLCVGSAGATTVVSPNGGTSVTYGTGSASVLDQVVGATEASVLDRVVTASQDGGVTVSERVGLTLGGNAIAVVAARTVTNATLGRSLMGVKMAWDVGTAVGGDIAKWLGLGPISPGQGVVPTNDGWMADPGQAPTQTSAVTCEAQDILRSQVIHHASGATYAACLADLAGMLDGSQVTAPDGTRSSTSGCFVNSSDPALAGISCTVSVAFTNGTVSQFTGSAPNVANDGVKPVSSCPAVIDALNPEWSNSSPPVRSDGTCPTGRYSGLSGDTGASKLANLLSSLSAADRAQLVSGLLSQGTSVLADGERTLTGPDSVVGQPVTTTTTNPDGSTTTVTTTPKTNYTYSGDTASYSTTTDTTTQTCTNNSCNTTSTTTTTGGSSKAGGSDTGNDCQTNSGAVGCQDLGTPPSDTPTWTPKVITWAAETLGGSAACPADQSFTLPVLKSVMVLHWQPACDVAPTIRAGLLLLTALSCATYLVMTLKAGA